MEKYKIRAGTDGGMLLERSVIRSSLCLIMKNNAKTIGPCLESVRPLDEMNCIDTGSTDDTPKIAERLGARVYHFHGAIVFLQLAMNPSGTPAATGSSGQILTT